MKWQVLVRSSVRKAVTKLPGNMQARFAILLVACNCPHIGEKNHPPRKERTETEAIVFPNYWLEIMVTFLILLEFTEKFLTKEKTNEKNAFG